MVVTNQELHPVVDRVSLRSRGYNKLYFTRFVIILISGRKRKETWRGHAVTNWTGHHRLCVSGNNFIIY